MLSVEPHLVWQGSNFTGTSHTWIRSNILYSDVRCVFTSHLVLLTLIEGFPYNSEITFKLLGKVQAWCTLFCWKASSAPPSLGVPRVESVVLQRQLYFTGGQLVQFSALQMGRMAGATPVPSVPEGLLHPRNILYGDVAHSWGQGYQTLLLGALLEQLAGAECHRSSFPVCSIFPEEINHLVVGEKPCGFDTYSLFFLKENELCLWKDGTMLCPWFAAECGSDLK